MLKPNHHVILLSGPTGNQQLLADSSSTKPKNELSKLIPGYTAPLKLISSSSSTFGGGGGIVGGLEGLRHYAFQSDPSSRMFQQQQSSLRCTGLAVKSFRGLAAPVAATPYANASQAPLVLNTNNKKGSTTSSMICFKTGRPIVDPSVTASKLSMLNSKKKRKHTNGSSWEPDSTILPPTPITNEVRQDLAIIRNRSYMDPKRFYKTPDQDNGTIGWLQVGTVIEGPMESKYTQRLIKRQRRSNLLDEVLANPSLSSYTQNKYRSIQQEKTAIALSNKRKKHHPSSKHTKQGSRGR